RCRRHLQRPRARGEAAHRRSPEPARWRAAFRLAGGALSAELAHHHAASGRAGEGWHRRSASRWTKQHLSLETRTGRARARLVAEATHPPRAGPNLGTDWATHHHRTRTATKADTKESKAIMKTPKIFRITLEVSNIDEASAFYEKLLGT